ncbi:MAG: DciA family protein [Ectothiorhodospiraceae bacterium]
MAANDRGPRRVGATLASGHTTVAGLYERAEALLGYEQVLLAELPAGARTHVRLARLDRQELVLATDGPEWRHRLRYLGARLRGVAAEKLGIEPARVTVKVTDLPRRPRQAPPRELSEQAARTLESASRHAPNPRLAAALARLASRGSAPEGTE